jgi:hypothetical protein
MEDTRHDKEREEKEDERDDMAIIWRRWRHLSDWKLFGLHTL